jgi:class 3 adenylate cyclase
MRADPKIAQKVLSLLRAWGWETGLEKLKATIDDTDHDESAELHFFIGWMAGERGAYEEALEQFQVLEGMPEWKPWALIGQAFIAMRQTDYQRAHRLLDEATEEGHPQDDAVLRATIAHGRGAVFYHEGENERALSLLCEALSLFGNDHFATGRVLDTLGMIYDVKDNFHAAREFYHRALECKLRFEDDAGIALSHGQLGRLYFDWGNVRQAEEHFRKDLELARRIYDVRGEAQMYNYLGKVAISQGQWKRAAAWLDKSIQLSQQQGWTVLEGFARKDRAVCHLGQSEIEEAEAQVKSAQELFKAMNFVEGLAHTHRVYGMVWRAQERYDEAERALRSALHHFDERQEYAEATRTQLEIARTLRAQGTPLVIDELRNALDRAERCRRDALVREIEKELKEVDEAAHYWNIYQRARGRDVGGETDSLLSGERETTTVMFLDVQNSTVYVRSNDPEVVMMTLNQMMAEFAGVVERHHVSVTAYLGDGFMALVRGADHARRAVRAALALEASLKDFNRPRRILGLEPLNIRTGIATGQVYIGNVGTYRKMDFTAIGTPANLAARLQSEAEAGLPCISRETYEIVQADFVFGEKNPRRVQLKGLGEKEAWDVIGQKNGPERARKV